MEREQYNKYLNEYMKEKYKENVSKYKELLGGKCVRCGSTEHLEFDHIEPDLKSFTITSRIHTAPEEVILEELKKCQLLCSQCHDEKTLEDLGQVSAIGTHGTLSSYRYCKCDLCKKAKNDYMVKWKHKKGISKEYMNTENRNKGLVHGTANAYNYYGCRCDLCKKYNNERQKDYKARKKLEEQNKSN